MRPDDYIVIGTLLLFGLVAAGSLRNASKAGDRADHWARRCIREVEGRTAWEMRARRAEASRREVAQSIPWTVSPACPAPSNDDTVTLPKQTTDTAIIPVQSAKTDIIPAMALQDAT